ncbi:MAG: cytochrome c-type biogenesis protein CcmH [Alphaproteobacteria bacterium]|nr:cytochrome c-type biogenesis protein CcmH [Alphaproteobacteria bacterium]MDE2111145.1 cytochrome c-type biogenesis protein CcmH [Alphaproteobacteria bacterium]MDE2495963.1 cytochrome c-type biogenesis protein CcmH [Alphaproteobacteria bacterium]
MKLQLVFFAAFAMLLFSATAIRPAAAVEPDEVLTNPALEARARTISSQLRCLVCQNESIDESNAPLAHDLRVLVRKRLLTGDSNEQVKAYIVARYGNYVLLKPPFIVETYILWFGPLILLLSATAAVIFFFRHRAYLPSEPAPLTDDERRNLSDLLDEPDDNMGVG